MAFCAALSWSMKFVAVRLQHEPGSIDPQPILQTAQLFREFGEDYHERMLEEAHVFPTFDDRTDEAAQLVPILKAQHERGREITSYIMAAAGSGTISDPEQFASTLLYFDRMYRAHAAREDTVLFPAQPLLSPSEYGNYAENFEEIERQTFGADGFGDAVRRIATVEAELGIGDLARFLATEPPETEQDTSSLTVQRPWTIRGGSWRSVHDLAGVELFAWYLWALRA
jgi:hemerythrin-like domain-containing protein